MRFAYIDSNGNEVPIPSVDALALRIELGAITENTQLYDAQADEWGPAHSHEIFHSLQRDVAEDDGFVAPPPVAPPPSAPAAPATPSAERPPERDPAPAAPTASAAEPDDDAVTPPADDDAETPTTDDSFGLTLAEPQPSADDGSSGAADDLGLSLAESEEPGGEGSTGREVAAAGGESDDEGAVFDFGDVGELEVEEAIEAPDAPMSFAPDAEGGTTDLGGGMGLETSMEFDASDFDAGGFDGNADTPLDLEAPMSEFTPEAPPAWMDEGETDDGVLDFSAASAAAGEPGEVEVPLRERRTPRNKPSPPKLRKQRNLALPMVVVVLALAVGIGGYAAWPIVSDLLEGGGEVETPAVFLPPLSEELMPTMRSSSEAALASLFERARSEWAATSTVREPPADWLAGVYLANASAYPAVETFWVEVGDFVDRVRAVDLAAFDAALSAELQASGLAATQATAVRERADSGFVAANPDRTDIYDRFDRLVDAALDLHAFLVANEGAIEHAPASAVTTDPILEVNPATPEIRAALEGLLEEVTTALGAVDYRERVTSEGLRSRIRTQIQSRGVR